MCIEYESNVEAPRVRLIVVIRGCTIATNGCSGGIIGGLLRKDIVTCEEDVSRVFSHSLPVPERDLRAIVGHGARVEEAPEELILAELSDDGRPLRPIAQGLHKEFVALGELHQGLNLHRYVLIVVTGRETDTETCIGIQGVRACSQRQILIDQDNISKNKGQELIKFISNLIVEEFINVEFAVDINGGPSSQLCSQFESLHLFLQGRFAIQCRLGLFEF